jgi:hypothetical protein
MCTSAYILSVVRNKNIGGDHWTLTSVVNKSVPIIKGEYTLT